MATIAFYVENLWRWKCELPELSDEPVADLFPTSTTRGLRNMNWSEKFESRVRAVFQGIVQDDLDWFFTHCQNRMIMGAFRYGVIGTNKSQSYNHLSSIPKRLIKFRETNNVEYLLDIYNLYMLHWYDTGKETSVVEAVGIVNTWHTQKCELSFNSIDDDNVHSEKH